jgi:hypothetical protein
MVVVSELGRMSVARVVPDSTRMSEAVFVHNFYVATGSYGTSFLFFYIRLVRHRFRLSIEEG